MRFTALAACLLFVVFSSAALAAGDDDDTATAPATATQQTAANSDEDVREAPHYYRWIDDKGRLNFSDLPPQDKNIKVLKEPLLTVPEIGSGTNLTNTYNRASDIMGQTSGEGRYNEAGEEER